MSVFVTRHNRFFEMSQKSSEPTFDFPRAISSCKLYIMWMLLSPGIEKVKVFTEFVYRLYYTFFRLDVFTSEFILSRQWAVKVSTNKNFVGLAATNGISYLLIESNLLVLVVWGININKAQFIFIDGSVYNNKSAVFICSNIQHLFT